MKGKSFKIKISDLLNHLGTDHISFKGEKTSLLPTLTEEGIQGNIVLNAIDGENILVSLQDVNCSLLVTCDACGCEFLRSIDVDEYIATFSWNPKELEESCNEVMFLINQKNETIDLEDMLYQAVHIDDPFIMKCKNCSKKIIEENVEELR